MVRASRIRGYGIGIRLRLGLIVLMGATVLASQGPQKLATPRPGWLYVVASDYRNQNGQVLLVDPDPGKVVSVLETGYEPDIVLSADGARLYLSHIESSAAGPRGTFEVIDTTDGTVVRRFDDADPWPSRGMAYASRMALSRDGRWLFRFKIHTVGEQRSYYVETFDTERLAVLPERALVPLCGSAMLIASAQRETVYVACSVSQDVRVLTLTEQGGSVDRKIPRISVGEAAASDEYMAPFLTQSGQVLTVVRGDGRFVKVNTNSQQVLLKDAVDRSSRNVVNGVGRQMRGREPANQNDWLAGRQVMRQVPVVSPDGERLYLITATGTDSRAVRDRVAVLNSDTLDRLQTFLPSHPFVSISISADGKALYAVDTLNAAVLVIDTTTGQELRTISGVGTRPVFAVVVP